MMEEINIPTVAKINQSSNVPLSGDLQMNVNAQGIGG